MFRKALSFFSHQSQVKPSIPDKWFKQKLKDSGLNAKFSPEILKQTQQSVKVYYNASYFSPEATDSFSLKRALTNIPAINVAGDKQGFFQNGLKFPADPSYFATIPVGHPELLSARERLASAKKVIFSLSQAFASGGYPATNPIQLYDKETKVGAFSLAGATFENHYLHYSLFMLDQINHVIKDDKFAHLFADLPLVYAEAKKYLEPYDLNHSLTRIRIGFPFLARSFTGKFYPSLGKSNAVIFLSKAYFRHQLEDISLLLTSVNEVAKTAGKPALLKATSVGMGFFAKIDGSYDIQHILYPYYLRAFKKLLSEQSYPWIAAIEFPTFDETQQELFDSIFDKFDGKIGVYQSGRDVLQFTAKELDCYYPCIINPSDAFSYVGNEWGYGSVESMIGNNTSLRFDQVYHANPWLLDPSRHIAVNIDNKNFSAEILQSDTPLNQQHKKFT